MAELEIGAPLACGEYEEEEDDADWNDFSENIEEGNDLEQKQGDRDSYSHSDSQFKNQKNNSATSTKSTSCGTLSNSFNSEDLSFMDCFMEKGKSGSLEDLVNTFDKKLSECFGDYKNNVSTIAPAQVRSQEDIINGCQ